MSFSDFKVLSLKARLPNRQRGMSVLAYWPTICRLPDAKLEFHSYKEKKNDILCPLTDDLIHEAALLYILKGKNLLSDSRDVHFMGVFCG